VQKDFKNVQELIKGVIELAGIVESQAEKITDLYRRMALVETQQGYLANRPPPPIPPFPRSLVDIGKIPPEGMRVVG